MEPHIRSRQITRRWSRDTCALEVFALTYFGHRYMGFIWIFGFLEFIWHRFIYRFILILGMGLKFRHGIF